MLYCKVMIVFLHCMCITSDLFVVLAYRKLNCTVLVVFPVNVCFQMMFQPELLPTMTAIEWHIIRVGQHVINKVSSLKKTFSTLVTFEFPAIFVYLLMSVIALLHSKRFWTFCAEIFWPLIFKMDFSMSFDI